MKKLLLFILPIVLLASCQQYDNTIHGRGISANGVYRPIDSLDIVYAKDGFTHIDSSHAGNPLISDSVYTVSPSWSQAWAWAGQRNDRAWFWVGLVIMILFLGVFIMLTSKGNTSMGLLLLPAIAILVGGALMGGSIEWERWNMDQTITKALYNSLMQVNGNLGGFWDTIRIK